MSSWTLNSSGRQIKIVIYPDQVENSLKNKKTKKSRVKEIDCAGGEDSRKATMKGDS